MIKECPVCKKKFEAVKNAKYCCDECRKAARNASQRRRYGNQYATTGLVCIKCGERFKPRTRYASDRLFCYNCVPEEADTSGAVKFKELNKQMKKKLIERRKYGIK